MKRLFSSFLYGFHFFIILVLAFCTLYGLSSSATAHEANVKQNYLSGSLVYLGVLLSYLLLFWFVGRFFRKNVFKR